MTAMHQPAARFPATDFDTLSYSTQFVYENPTGAACTPPTQPSSVVGDSTNSFCIDTEPHRPTFNLLYRSHQRNACQALHSLKRAMAITMNTPAPANRFWRDRRKWQTSSTHSWRAPHGMIRSFFLSYDEGGGPYDHVPPVPGHSNDFTDTTSWVDCRHIPDCSKSGSVQSHAVPSGGIPTLHCDLSAIDPEPTPGMLRPFKVSPRNWVFACQTSSFRLSRADITVSHTPMDHTAVIKFVENQFHREFRSLNGPRCSAAKSAGFLRLQQGPMGYAADSAGPCF